MARVSDAAAIAADYSATGAAWQHGPGRIYDVLAERLVRDTPTRWDGRLVIDVGAGTGAASRAIARAGGRPLATDFAPGMLTGADDRPPSAAADARALPIRTDGVDGWVAAFCLNHVPDPELALVEAVRVVRGGGPIVASAYAADDTHPAKAAVEAAAAEQGWVAPAWSGVMRHVTSPLLATVDSALAVAERADLGTTEVEAVAVPFPQLGVADLVAWRMGMAQMAPFVATLEPDARTAPPEPSRRAARGGTPAGAAHGRAPGRRLTLSGPVASTPTATAAGLPGRTAWRGPGDRRHRREP